MLCINTFAPKLSKNRTAYSKGMNVLCSYFWLTKGLWQLILPQAEHNSIHFPTSVSTGTMLLNFFANQVDNKKVVSHFNLLL